MSSDDFKKDLTDSVQAFDKYVKPVIESYLKCELTTVEGNTIEELAHQLDVNAGIDILLNDAEGMRGIANRVQFGSTNYQTFTMRKERISGAKTEYEKRVSAIDNEYLYPILTIQSYVDKDADKLLSVAIAKTKDIVEMIKNNKCYTKFNSDKRATFYVVEWYKMYTQGFNIFIHPKPKIQQLCESFQKVTEEC